MFRKYRNFDQQGYFTFSNIHIIFVEYQIQEYHNQDNIYIQISHNTHIGINN